MRSRRWRWRGGCWRASAGATMRRRTIRMSVHGVRDLTPGLRPPPLQKLERGLRVMIVAKFLERWTFAGVSVVGGFAVALTVSRCGGVTTLRLGAPPLHTFKIGRLCPEPGLRVGAFACF